MYDVKYLAKKHLRTTIAQISYLLICFKITYDVIRLRMVDIITLRKKCPYSYFTAFGLNTEIYSVNLHIHSECGKKDQKNSKYGQFLCSVRLKRN